MKTKLVISLFLIIGISLIAQPQRPRFGLEEFEPDKMLKRLSDQLALTDEQVEQIEPILFETQAKLKELKKQRYDDDQKMMEEHRAVMENNAEIIEEYLTNEQIEKFREIRKERPRIDKGERLRKGRNRW